jgi:hypothetical protein
MRRAGEHRHHHPAGIGPLGGPGRIGDGPVAKVASRRAGLALAATACLLGVLPLSGAAPSGIALAADAARVHLPTALDGLAYAPNAETILFGQAGIETQLPGAVQDTEDIGIDLGTTGAVDLVTVTQRLVLSGLGDFSFKVPGPARTVEALPESSIQPGLRKGAVLWQGFSPGRKALAARMEMFADQEALRLPLQLALGMTVGGRSFVPGRRSSGPLRLTLTVTNVSAVPIGLVDAEGDPTQLAATLDAIRAALADGMRPAPGSGGIAADIDIAGPQAQRSERVEVPFTVHGDVVFPPGTVGALTATGGTVTEQADGTHVAFSSELAWPGALSLRVDITGQATNLPLPKVTVNAGTGLVRPEALEPPSGLTWQAGLAADPSAFDGRAMLGLALDVLWRTARLRQFDAYLGNPDATGTSTSTYMFRLAPLTAKAEGPVAAVPRLGVFGAVGLGAVVLLLAFGLALAWARA